MVMKDGGAKYFNKANMLTKVMHLYSTGGFTCYWRIRGNE